MTAEGDAATEYQFNVDAGVSADYKKLFAMTKCLIFYHAAGDTIPIFESGSGKTNSYTLTNPVLELRPLLPQAIANAAGVYPLETVLNRTIGKYFFWNFDDASLETHLVPLIGQYLTDAQKQRLGTTSTGTTLDREWFNAFKASSTVPVVANGNDQIAELAIDSSSSSSSVYRLNAFFGISDYKKTSFDFDDDDSIKAYFFYRQRLSSGIWGVSLTSHPMICWILGIPFDSSRVDLGGSPHSLDRKSPALRWIAAAQK